MKKKLRLRGDVRKSGSLKSNMSVNAAKSVVRRL